MKAMGYVRVSTDEQAREGISLDNQKAKIESYCALHDLELIGIVEDPGKSGKDLNREGMRELVDHIKGRQVNAVIVYKLDRLSRKVIDTLNLIELMRRHNIEFHSITDNIDTKTAMGKFFLNVMASLAQMERDLISERTKDALQHKIDRNERAGQIPYGWTLSPDRKTLLPNPKEQKAIALIRDLHNKGYSYRAICRELDKKGHKPVGKVWHAKTIGSILKRAA
ncbi:MAG TPA: recombinase family protein [Syntrophorhabdaceae bacterium]|nr:recombinase family protein [Syntrophorhabdaceae bacterium]